MLDGLILDRIRTFATVVRAGSFRAGAQQLHRVQSAVSFAIASREVQLGVELCDRSGYRPVLTTAGQALLKDVRAALARSSTYRRHAITASRPGCMMCHHLQDPALLPWAAVAPPLP